MSKYLNFALLLCIVLTALNCSRLRKASNTTREHNETHANKTAIHHANRTANHNSKHANRTANHTGHNNTHFPESNHTRRNNTEDCKARFAKKVMNITKGLSSARERMNKWEENAKAALAKKNISIDEEYENLNHTDFEMYHVINREIMQVSRKIYGLGGLGCDEKAWYELHSKLMEVMDMWKEKFNWFKKPMAKAARAISKKAEEEIKEGLKNIDESVDKWEKNAKAVLAKKMSIDEENKLVSDLQEKLVDIGKIQKEIRYIFHTLDRQGAFEKKTREELYSKIYENLNKFLKIRRILKNSLRKIEYVNEIKDLSETLDQLEKNAKSILASELSVEAKYIMIDKLQDDKKRIGWKKNNLINHLNRDQRWYPKTFDKRFQKEFHLRINEFKGRLYKFDCFLGTEWEKNMVEEKKNKHGDKK